MTLFWATEQEREAIKRLRDSGRLTVVGGKSVAEQDLANYDHTSVAVNWLHESYNRVRLDEPTEDPSVAIMKVAKSLEGLVQSRQTLDAIGTVLNQVIGYQLDLSTPAGVNTASNVIQYGPQTAKEMDEITQGFRGMGSSVDQVWQSYLGILVGNTAEPPSAKLAAYVEMNSSLEERVVKLPPEAAAKLNGQLVERKYATLERSLTQINDRISQALATPANTAITNDFFPQAIEEVVTIAATIPTLEPSIKGAIKSYVRTIAETDIAATSDENVSGFAFDLKKASENVGMFGDYTPTVAAALGERAYSMARDLAAEPSTLSHSNHVETINYLGQVENQLKKNNVYNLPNDFEELLYGAARNLAFVELEKDLEQIDVTDLAVLGELRNNNVALRELQPNTPKINISQFIKKPAKEAWERVTQAYTTIASETNLDVGELMKPLQAQYSILMEARE